MNFSSTNAPVTENMKAFINLLLSFLVLITVIQFSSFAIQSVQYILGVIFGVAVESTPLDALIGFWAMGASALVFAGSLLYWFGKPRGTKWLILGGSLFAVKNVFDLINESIIFNMKNTITTVEQIRELSSILGSQFVQLAFWFFVAGFFYYFIAKRQTGIQL